VAKGLEEVREVRNNKHSQMAGVRRGVQCVRPARDQQEEISAQD